MTQYLLAVHIVEGEPEPSAEEMQKAYADVDSFNTELRDAGAWVFAGGLKPSATVLWGWSGASSTLGGRGPPLWW